MSKALEAPSVKEQLIQALKNLSGLQQDEKFQQLINHLEDPEITIPQSKPTLDLLKFTYLLICQYPQILSDPSGQPLRNLCKNAVRKITGEALSGEEIKTQQPLAKHKKN